MSQLKKHNLGYVQPKHFPDLPDGWTVSSQIVNSSGAEDIPLFFMTCARAEQKKTSVFEGVLIVHGFGEHAGRYLHVPHYLSPSVENVFFYDHRGHGKSGGQRGDAPHFDILKDDFVLVANRLMANLKQTYVEVKLHILAHSMGGTIVLSSIQKLSFIPASLILSAPALALKKPPHPFARLFVSACNAVLPHMQLSVEVDPQILSQDEAVWEAHAADRLIHKKMSPSFFVGMQATGASLTKTPLPLPCPTLFLIPMQDALIDSAVTVLFARRVSAQKKIIQELNGFFHEPLNEINKGYVFDIITDWIGPVVAERQK